MRWLLSAAFIAASWMSAGATPASVVAGLPWTGTSGPMLPTEEQEHESSTPLVVESRGSARRGERVAESEVHRRTPSVLRQTAVLPASVVARPRGSFDGHRLANGLMAPLQT